MTQRAAVIRKVKTFLFLTLLCSVLFYWLIIAGVSAQLKVDQYFRWWMWCPGLAALATQLIYQQSLAGLGWKWSDAKFLLIAYSIPLFYVFAAYGFLWITGLGSFSGISRPDGSLAGEVHSGATSKLIAFSATLGVLRRCLSALGEEIGWRGFLVPQLSRLVAFPKVALLSGLIWSVWHYPVVIFGGYNAQTSTWFALPCFTTMVIAMSVILAWLRLKSGSVWPCMVFHASHNLFVALIAQFTLETRYTRYLAGEFGALIPIVVMMGAGMIWKFADVENSNSSVQP